MLKGNTSHQLINRIATRAVRIPFLGQNTQLTTFKKRFTVTSMSLLGRLHTLLGLFATLQPHHKNFSGFFWHVAKNECHRLWKKHVIDELTQALASYRQIDQSSEKRSFIKFFLFFDRSKHKLPMYFTWFWRRRQWYFRFNGCRISLDVALASSKYLISEETSYMSVDVINQRRMNKLYSSVFGENIIKFFCCFMVQSLNQTLLGAYLRLETSLTWQSVYRYEQQII